MKVKDRRRKDLGSDGPLGRHLLWSVAKLDILWGGTVCFSLVGMLYTAERLPPFRLSLAVASSNKSYGSHELELELHFLLYNTMMIRFMIRFAHENLVC